VALSVGNLAQLRVVQGQPEKAEPLYRRALTIREQALGPFHPEVAKTLEDLANVLRKVGRTDEAISLEVRARDIRMKRS
jgi:Flp pilus assembly protein TadD